MENIGYNYLVLLFLRQYVLDWINFSSFGRLFGQILFFKKKGGRKSRKSLLILNKYIANGYSGFHSTFRETVNSILQKDNGYFLINTNEKDIYTKTVIVATGTIAKNLGIPGEDRLKGVGISYCATCDGPFFRDKEVLVIGGGDSAIVEALFLTRFASKVTVIHRRGELRATKVLQDDAFKNPKIEFSWHSVVSKFQGETKLEGAVIKDVRTDNTKLIKADGIFIAIGSNPDTQFVKGMVDTDARGYIITDGKMKTITPGLFAAGDVRSKSLRQVVTAVSDGAIAAVEAGGYLLELERASLR